MKADRSQNLQLTRDSGKSVIQVQSKCWQAANTERECFSLGLQASKNQCLSSRQPDRKSAILLLRGSDF